MGAWLQRCDRLWALGRDTYMRLYPNPGVGVRLRRWRAALSVHRGLEIFELSPRGDWALRMRRFNRKLEGKAWGS